MGDDAEPLEGRTSLPDWVPGRTIYHLHSLGAAGGRGLGAITGWLDHVAALGCGAVLLTPIHESSSHGYDTIDAMRLDPRLGQDADLDTFISACHERDLRVVFDGVFNHVGRAFPRTELLSGQVWEGHDELPLLDHANDEVLEWATQVGRHWLDRGGDGWRIDVAYTIPRPFLRALTASIRAHRPDAFIFGEIVHGRDYAGLVRDTGLDGVTQYELWKALWSSLNDDNMWELAWALERHRGFARDLVPVTFVGNHDVSRIASVLHNPGRLGLALAVLFTVPGVPCVYYGDELGWQGEKRRGPHGDDPMRQALPATVPEHSAIDEHRRWIEFRRDHPDLTDASVEVIDKTNRTLTYRAGGFTVHLDIDAGVTVDAT